VRTSHPAFDVAFLVSETHVCGTDAHPVVGTQIYAVDVIGFCYWNLLITVVSSGDADVFIAAFGVPVKHAAFNNTGRTCSKLDANFYYCTHT
jgi:hypothetical protein